MGKFHMAVLHSNRDLKESLQQHKKKKKNSTLKRVTAKNWLSDVRTEWQNSVDEASMKKSVDVSQGKKY